jgi:hypothetical protein
MSADPRPYASESAPADPRQEWLADRALFGAAAEPPPSLRLADHLDEGFNLAAAAIDLALLPVAEAPPAGLRDRVTQRLQSLAAASAGESTQLHRGGSAVPSAAATAAGRGTSWGWYAAGIALAIAVAAWWPSSRPREASPPLGPESFRAALLADASTALLEGSCTGDPLCTREGVCGDVVWNPGRREGYLRVAGLAPNDPREFQYQLWIVDSSRDDRYPVDGGVFDVPPGRSELVVPIRAAVPVGEAAVFAVSVERPGGVVVSDRRFVLVAAAPTK